MAGLVLLSVPWLALGWWIVRPWALLLPFLFWLAFTWLEGVGFLPGTTSLDAALLAGAVGATFAGVGILSRSRLRPRAA